MLKDKDGGMRFKFTRFRMRVAKIAVDVRRCDENYNTDTSFSLLASRLFWLHFLFRIGRAGGVIRTIAWKGQWPIRNAINDAIFVLNDFFLVQDSGKPVSKTFNFSRPITEKELEGIWEEQVLRLLVSVFLVLNGRLIDSFF